MLFVICLLIGHFALHFMTDLPDCIKSQIELFASYLKMIGNAADKDVL